MHTVWKFSFVMNFVTFELISGVRCFGKAWSLGDGSCVHEFVSGVKGFLSLMLIWLIRFHCALRWPRNIRFYLWRWYSCFWWYFISFLRLVHLLLFVSFIIGCPLTRDAYFVFGIRGRRSCDGVFGLLPRWLFNCWLFFHFILAVDVFLVRAVLCGSGFFLLLLFWWVWSGACSTLAAFEVTSLSLTIRILGGWHREGLILFSLLDMWRRWARILFL